LLNLKNLFKNIIWQKEIESLKISVKNIEKELIEKEMFKDLD